MSAIGALLKRIGTLEDYIIELLRRDQDNQRRIANIMRPGKVTEVDAAKGLVKVQWGKDESGHPVTTSWIPWSTRAGKIKDWNPPSVGEQVLICSPCGEMGPSSWVQPGGYSSSNQRNSNKDGERVISIGGTSLEMTDRGVTLKTGTFRVEAGKVEYQKAGGAGGAGGAKPSVQASDVPMS